MAWNGSGTFARLYNWATDLAAGAPDHFIQASKMDGEMDGFTTGINACLTKNGENSPSANLPMNSKKHTGVAAGSARTEYADVANVQDSGFIHATSSGTDTVILTLAPVITAYAAGQMFTFLAGGTNTGATTLNVNAVGAKAVQKNLAALVAGDITANDIVTVVYDGTQFQMVSPARTPVLTAGGILGASVAAATDTTRGTVELATDAETITGTDTDRAVTPANVQAKVASATAKGIVELATDAETITGSDTERAVTPANVQAKVASATAKGIVELATAAETTTGTDTGRAVTPDGLAGSDYGKTVVQLLIFDDGTDCATGNGAGDLFWRVPSVLNGYDLVDVAAQCQTAGTTGTMDIQIYNVTQTADMLSTVITIDSTETDSSTAATPAVIDTGNDDVATADQIRIDVDAVHTTAAKGLMVELTFQLP